MSPRRQGSAATLVSAPESAEPYVQQLLAARQAAAHSAAALAAICAAPRPRLEELIRASDEALDDAGRLRGLAALVRRQT